jgi:DAK2 domain fusion protein YloV
MLTALDAPTVRHWSAALVRALEAHQVEIDELNVYPVPDGDTGTNMALTAHAGADALGASPAADPKGCLAALARGAVLGARGNSGVIMSQILRGLADACPERPAAADNVAAADNLAADPALVDGAVLADGLARATELAYAAVAVPVEGTILTVARAAAEAAKQVSGSGLDAVVLAACRGAAQALERTPSQLPALARAGVVDAGGRGLVVVLDALAAVVTGRAPDHPPVRRMARDRQALEAAREAGSTEFGYEVQYLLHAREEPATRLRAELADLGDSVVVVGSGDGVWNVHVHTNDVGAAVEAGVQAGQPYRITVIRFADQIAADQIAADRRAAADRPVRDGTAVVAIAPDSELARLLRAEGVLVVDANPSTGQLLAAIVDSGAARVVVLPNHRDRTAVAVAAAEEARAAGIQVAVVPTRSPVQGLAAVAVHDESRRFDDDVIAMAETAAATRSAEITIAVRDAITMAGQCTAGDVLGLVEGDVLLIGGSVVEVAVELVNRLLGTGGELMTVILGADAPDGLADLLERHLAGTHPEVELVVYEGGQPLYPVLLGVE